MKIGLIAMSGIRACDAELLELGLTLPGFVERSKTIASLPSLGLLTLAGMTPKRHELHYFEVADLKQAEHLPNEFDLVAISSFSAQAKEGYVLARRFVDRGVPVVMGGLHVTSVPHEPAMHGASAMLGEGEIVWADILRDAERGRLKPVYDARGREFDLADAPMPAFELLDIEKYNRLTVQTSRGCPWRCEFCASSILLTERYKQKSVEQVLREIDKIRELWPRPFIEFADDNAFVNRAYWHRLLPELAKRRIKWFAETDLSVSEDDELLESARRAGCAELLIGFESPIEQGLDGIELRRNWKKRKWPIYKQVIRRIQSHGIRVNACFVVGLDGHTTDIFDAVYDFVEDAAPFDVQITYQTPFPNTPLYHRLKKQGRLTHDGQWERCTLFDINYDPTPMSAVQLRRGFHELSQRLYSESFTAWRRDRFRRQHRRSPWQQRRCMRSGQRQMPIRLPFFP
ncbi:MAG: radical SAM protein [Phycisphaerales bacterium]